MKILIRTDASVEIGIGHLMRCLTLADQLQGNGAEVAFVCHDLPDEMTNMLDTRGYRNMHLPLVEAANNTQQIDAEETIKAGKQLFPDGIDWLVVDHYGLDSTWESLLRPHARKLLVIDDSANRPHDCDLLLDQNYYRDLDRRYQDLVPDKCITLLGPAYALLRQEFVDARKQLRVRDGSVSRILIFFGGSDSTNQTQKALNALTILSEPDIAVDVVVGATNPFRDKIRHLCEKMPNVQYHCQATNMAELILAADIAIGAGGATTWERCSLGLPTLTVVFADNQLQTTLDLENYGAIKFLGWADTITEERLASSIKDLIENPVLLENLTERAYFIMKEWVGVSAVTDVMKNKANNLSRNIQ